MPEKSINISTSIRKIAVQTGFSVLNVVQEGKKYQRFIFRQEEGKNKTGFYELGGKTPLTRKGLISLLKSQKTKEVQLVQPGNKIGFALFRKVS